MSASLMPGCEWASDPALPAIAYKPGWTFSFQMANGLTFCVIDVEGPDAKGVHARTGGPRSVRFALCCPLPFDPAWLLNRLDGIESHETREWLVVDGLTTFDPHRESGVRDG